MVEAARTFAWTRDPFDRLIVANAIADGVKLLTADEIILAPLQGRSLVRSAPTLTKMRTAD